MPVFEKYNKRRTESAFCHRGGGIAYSRSWILSGNMSMYGSFGFKFSHLRPPVSSNVAPTELVNMGGEDLIELKCIYVCQLCFEKLKSRLRNSLQCSMCVLV